MAKFVLAYHGGSKGFKTKEEGQAHMKSWRAWEASLGDVTSMYFGKSKTVSTEGIADDGGSNPLSGITIMQADTLADVLEKVKKCPHLGIGGSVEVVQAMEM